MPSLFRHRRDNGLFVLLACAILFGNSFAQARDPQTPRLSAITDAVQPFIDNKEIAGAVTVVVGTDQVLHLGAAGKADIAADKPMQADHIFWIASMTKPITATMVLMLHEDGKLSVDDPVEKYIPEFGKLKNAAGETATVTIRHLLTHTAGLGEITPEQAKKIVKLEDLIPLYVAQPVKHAPGSKWVYSQSAINSLARIVEVVSKKPFTDFLEERLTGPLKMKDTTFYLSEEQHGRLAQSYKRTDAGILEPAENFILMGMKATDRERFPAANGGLFSTAADYARFAQMILRGGELDGRRYLKPETIKLMTTLATGDLKTGFIEGSGWALGWISVSKPQGASEALSVGSFGHGGAYGTQVWIDPTLKVAYILMVQRSNFNNADKSDLRREFQNAAAKDFVTRTTKKE